MPLGVIDFHVGMKMMTHQIHGSLVHFDPIPSHVASICRNDSESDVARGNVRMSREYMGRFSWGEVDIHEAAVVA